MFYFRGVIKEKDQTSFYAVEINELGVFTQGKTIKECHAMAQDALKELGLGNVSIKAISKKEFYITSDNPKFLIARFLETMRLRANLTIQNVTDRLKLKSRNSYAQYEQGKVMPTIEKLSEMINAIDSEQFLLLSTKPKLS